MKDNGFSVEVKDVQNLSTIKSEYQIPMELQSCHTAIVDGYVIEGHVPVAEVNRLLAEHPDVAGLAVPGMPSGSPGMEMPGVAADPFDVLAFQTSGAVEVYASYNK